jgi:hypothetical protein
MPPLACDPDLDIERMAGHLYGLNNVRFWARGLTDPQSSCVYDAAIEEEKWARRRQKGLRVPAPPK